MQPLFIEERAWIDYLGRPLRILRTRRSAFHMSHDYRDQSYHNDDMFTYIRALLQRTPAYLALSWKDISALLFRSTPVVAFLSTPSLIVTIPHVLHILRLNGLQAEEPFSPVTSIISIAAVGADCARGLKLSLFTIDCVKVWLSVRVSEISH
jgi:hypothetical protein